MNKLAYALLFSILTTHGVLAQWSPHADTIFVGGTIVTVDAAFSTHEALAVKAMKAGARNYIVKDIENNFLTLLPTMNPRSRWILRRAPLRALAGSAFGP